MVPLLPRGVRLLARSLPIVRSGEWYHVVNRGVERCRLFTTGRGAAAFVSGLGGISKQFAVEVHAYCVVGSHYHLLVRAQEEELRRAVQKLEEGIPGETGRAHLFRIVAGRHLLKVTRYIHRNPVEARLVESPADWPWSSYRGYLDHLDAPQWLRSDAVLGWLGSIGARQRYRQYVEDDGCVERPDPLSPSCAGRSRRSRRRSGW